MATKYKIVFTHETDPDFSWLEQDMYNPTSSEYEPVYRSEADMKAGRDPIDADDYRDPSFHVALLMLVYAMADDDDDWELVDSLGNIDFLADSDDWQTGTYYRVDDIPARCAYLHELASDAINAHNRRE